MLETAEVAISVDAMNVREGRKHSVLLNRGDNYHLELEKMVRGKAGPGSEAKNVVLDLLYLRSRCVSSFNIIEILLLCSSGT